MAVVFVFIFLVESFIIDKYNFLRQVPPTPIANLHPN